MRNVESRDWSDREVFQRTSRIFFLFYYPRMATSFRHKPLERVWNLLHWVWNVALVRNVWKDITIDFSWMFLKDSFNAKTTKRSKSRMHLDILSSRYSTKQCIFWRLERFFVKYMCIIIKLSYNNIYNN